MAVTPEQKHVIDCVLAIFETGRVPTAASYSTCTILPDKAGISYGKHQCTDHSGSLDKVVRRYIDLGGKHAVELEKYETYLASNASTTVPPKGPWPQWCTELVNLLKAAGQDPVMHAAQDQVFDEVYWSPAVNIAKGAGIVTALGHLVIYDTCIHSGPGMVGKIRNMFAAKAPINGGDEKEWVKSYVNARRGWLAAFPNPIVQGTVYRPDAFKVIIDAGNWELRTPLVVRGQKIG